MEDLSVFVPNVHFEQIPIKNLVSNQEYQRTLSQTHIARAAANFDLIKSTRSRSAGGMGSTTSSTDSIR